MTDGFNRVVRFGSFREFSEKSDRRITSGMIRPDVPDRCKPRSGRVSADTSRVSAAGLTHEPCLGRHEPCLGRWIDTRAVSRQTRAVSRQAPVRVSVVRAAVIPLRTFVEEDNRNTGRGTTAANVMSLKHVCTYEFPVTFQERGGASVYVDSGTRHETSDVMARREHGKRMLTKVQVILVWGPQSSVCFSFTSFSLLFHSVMSSAVYAILMSFAHRGVFYRHIKYTCTCGYPGRGPRHCNSRPVGGVTSSKFDLTSNVLQKKRVARILFFKIRSSQEILKILTRILVFKSKPSQEILKIRDGTPWEAEEILTYIKKPSKQIDCHFSTKLDLPSNVVQNKRVARILFFKIRSSQEILKIRDGTPWEAEEILTYIKKPSKQIDCHFSTKFDLPSNVLQNKRVARILFFKIRSSQEFLKIRDGTPLEAEEILTYIKKPSKRCKPSQEILKIRDGAPWEAEEILTYIKKPSKQIDCHFSTKLDLPSNVVQNKRVARILFFKIRSSQEFLKIRDGTPLEPSQEILKIRDGTAWEAEEILTYIKKTSKQIDCHFSTKLDLPSNVVQNKRKNRVTRILVFKSKPSQEILKIRDGTPWEAEEILTYIKKPSKQIDCHFSTKFDLPSNVVHNKRVARILFFKIRSPQEFLKIRDGTPLGKKRVARILFFKIRSSQEILKIRDGTPLEAEEILTYIKNPRNGSIYHFSTKFDVPTNIVQNKRVARILFFKIGSSQEILKIRDGTPLEAEEILTYIKNPRNGSIYHFSTKFDLPSNVLQKKRVARILFFKIRSSQEILKIRDGTPLEIDCHFSTKFDLPSNVVQDKRVARILFFKIRSSQEILKIRDGTPLEKKRVARILFFKIRSSQEILKIRDGTPWEAEEILTYIKKPSKQIDCHFSTKFDLPSNVVQNKRVARILFFKIRSSQEILKIRDGTPLEAEEILTYIKNPRNGSIYHFSTKFDVPTNIVQNKRVARILFFKIRSSQEILKIRDGTPLEKKRVARILFFKIRSSQEILKIRDGTPLEFDLPSNVLQKNRVTRILVFKSKPSQEILKIRDGTPSEAEEILTYIKKPSKQIDCHFSTKFDLPSNVVQNKRVARILFFKIRSPQEFLKIRDGTPLEKKRVARILFFKIRSSQEIIKIRDGTPLEAEEILTYIKNPRNGSIYHFSTKFDVPTNIVQNKRVARILFFKIRSSQEILKIRDGTPLEAEEILTYIKNPRNGSIYHFSTKFDLPSNVLQKKRVARILFFKIRSSQEILKIRDGTPLEAEEILTYIKYNVLQKNRVTRILVFKSKPSQEILKIRDGTPWEAEEILTYIKKPSKQIDCHFSTKFDLPSNVVQNKRVARILFFKIRSPQEFLKIRDGTPLEAEEILTYIKKPSKRIDFNVLQKNRVTRILVFKSKPSQEILKIRDGTPSEAEEILTYIKKPSKQIDCHFSTKFDLPSNVVQNKRVARILFFKIRSPQEFLKIRDGTPLEKKRVARILFFKIRSSQEILKIRDGTPLEAEEILTYIKNPRNRSIYHFSTKFDVPTNIVQNKRVARILFFKIRSSQEILKIRDGTPLEAEEILTYIKNPRNGSIYHFSTKFDLPSNVLQKKRVARILFFKIRSSQEILKIRDGTPLEAEEILTYIKYNVLQKNRVTRILVFKSKPSQEILKIRDGTPWEAEEILTYIKKPSKQIDCHFSTKFDLPSNVVQNKRVARILFFKIRSPQEFLKIRDGTPLEKKRVARILFFKIRSSQEILKIRDGTPLEAEEILTYIKNPRNGSIYHFSTKFDVPTNIVQNKRVARILFFKIRSSQEIPKFVMFDVPANIVQNKRVKNRVTRILVFKSKPSQEILKIRDGTPWEAEEILTYIKKPSKQIDCHFSTKFDLPSNKKRVARILFFKIRSSQEILKIRDGTPLEAKKILTYIKNSRNGSIYHFSTKFDVPTNIVQNKRVARILFFKIRSSQEILKICDDNVLQKNRVTRILVFKSKPSQEILKIRDGTPWEAEEILTYIKKPSKQIDCHFSTKFDLPSNVVQNKRVARILFFKIRSSQEFLKIRDGTPLEAEEILTYIKKPSKRIDFEILKICDGTPWEAEEILTYIKKPSKQIDCHFSTKFDLPSNVVQDKRVARILFFKIRSSQEILKIRDEILKIRDGTPWEAEEILTYIKKPSKQIDCHFSTKFDLPSNVIQDKRVPRILFFKIRSSQEILKIRDDKFDLTNNVLQKKRVARILFFKIRSSQEILKIRDGTPLEAEEILTYIKNPRNGSIYHFSTKFDVPTNIVQNKRVARILFFKIRSSQEILKICDGTSLEAEEILTYIKNPRNGSIYHFSTKFDVPANIVQNKRVARILFFKIRSSQEIQKFVMKNRVTRILVFKSKPSQEILKIRDGTPWEAEEILTYIKKPSKQIDCHFSTKFDLPSNKKRVARILFFKIRSSQEILKIRDGTPLEAKKILTYIKNSRNGSIYHFSTKFDVPTNIVQNKRVARILFFKIRSSQEILKICDGTPLEKKRVARILFFKIRSSQEILKIRDGTPLEKNRVTRILVFKSKPSQEILKIRDGTPWEAEEILTYIKKPSKQIDCHFSTKFDLPSNVVQNKRVARILFFKIRSSQEFLKIRDGTPLEAEEILTYIKKPSKRIDLIDCHFSTKFDLPSNVVQDKRVARILFFKIRSSQEILKIRDGTPLEIDCHFSTKFDLPSNVIQDKRVPRILFFKIRSSQEILKIRDGTPLEKKRVARILFFKIRPSQEILKICDGTPLEAEEILTYIKNPRNRSIYHFCTKFDVPTNIVQNKRVARILFFKIRSSQEIQKFVMFDLPSNVLQKNRVTRILVFKSKPSQEILKIRDGTPWEAEEILTYIKKPSKQIDCHFSTKFDLPSNVVQNKRVARILFFKIRSSQEFLKIRDGTPLECNVLQNNRVARILVFKSKPSQEILKIRDGTPWEAEEILTYIKKPSKQIDCHFSTKFDLPSNVVQNKRVARILFFKIRSSQEFLKIRDGTPLEAEEILTYIKKPSKRIDLSLF
ncbi:hypothetical protein OROGR_000800 [Orobanche gracilis]